MLTFVSHRVGLDICDLVLHGMWGINKCLVWALIKV